MRRSAIACRFHAIEELVRQAIVNGEMANDAQAGGSKLKEPIVGTRPKEFTLRFQIHES